MFISLNLLTSLYFFLKRNCLTSNNFNQRLHIVLQFQRNLTLFKLGLFKALKVCAPVEKVLANLNTYYMIKCKVNVRDTGKIVDISTILSEQRKEEGILPQKNDLLNWHFELIKAKLFEINFQFSGSL